MNAIRLFPLWFFVGYIITSLLVFAFGVWPWPTRTSWWLYVFMSFSIVAIYVGYKKGVGKNAGGFYSKFGVVQLYRISLFLTLILFIPTLLWRTGGDIVWSFDLLTDPSAAYRRSHNSRNFMGTAWIEYIRIILSVFLQLLIPLLVVYWEKLRKCERFLGILSILSNIILWISVGTNKGLGDIALAVSWSFLLRLHDKITFARLIKISLVILPIIVLFLGFFVSGQISRHNKVGVQDRIYSIGIRAERDGIVGYMPSIVQEGVIAFTNYWVQGYHGLAMSLGEPFVSTYGFGNSMFAATYADKYFGTDIERNTYPARVEFKTGWDSKVQWHTIYSWLASDVTFPGAVILMGLFSYLFAMSWVDSLHSQNPFALSLFLQFTIMFMYIPANNQVLQSGEGYVGFILTVLFWLYTRSNLKIIL